MADLRDPRVRFELRIEAQQAVAISGYSQPVTWFEIASNLNKREVELLSLYDAAITEDTEALGPGDELDSEYQDWRDKQAGKVVESELLLQTTGHGMGSSWIPAR